jgi:hypothetical protein
MCASWICLCADSAIRMTLIRHWALVMIPLFTIHDSPVTIQERVVPECISISPTRSILFQPSR